MNPKNKWQTIFQYCLSALIVCSFVAIVICLIFHLAPETNNNLLYLLAGALATMTGTVINWNYGSSKGSSDKNDMLYNSTPTVSPDLTAHIDTIVNAVKAKIGS